MFPDEVIAKTHKIREEYSPSSGHDLKAIFADLPKQQAESGREVVSLSPKHGHYSRGSRCLGEKNAKDTNRRSI